MYGSQSAERESLASVWIVSLVVGMSVTFSVNSGSE